MSLLDPIPQRYIPPNARNVKYKKGLLNENLETLNNDERKEVTEDFGDSPFADCLEEKEDESI